MPALDTNVLVRLITRDDAARTAAAESFVSGGTWVPLLSLAEAVWVLGSVYELSATDQAKAIEMLLNHNNLILNERELVAAALDVFRARPKLGFSDCLILESARRASQLPLGTFDRNLGKVPGARKLL